MANSSTRTLPQRNRIQRDIDIDKEEDPFWNQAFFDEESNDEGYEDESEEEDVVDDDFYLPEEPEEESMEEEEEKKTSKRGKKAYVDPRKKKGVATPKPKRKANQSSSSQQLPTRKKLVRAASAAIEQQREEQRAAKKRKVEKKPGRGRARVTYTMPSQEELLEEAKITEEYNLSSLNTMLQLEEEKKKANKLQQRCVLGPKICYKSTPTSTSVSFSDEVTLSTVLTGKAPPHPTKSKCAITAKPAKYRDPVTNKPYATKKAFQALRTKS